MKRITLFFCVLAIALVIGCISHNKMAYRDFSPSYRPKLSMHAVQPLIRDPSWRVYLEWEVPDYVPPGGVFTIVGSGITNVKGGKDGIKVEPGKILSIHFSSKNPDYGQYKLVYFNYVNDSTLVRRSWPFSIEMQYKTVTVWQDDPAPSFTAAKDTADNQ
jgi:hypothetical protein